MPINPLSRPSISGQAARHLAQGEMGEGEEERRVGDRELGREGQTDEERERERLLKYKNL